MKWPEDFLNRVIQGDCMEVLKEIPENVIDTVITDPPYGLSEHPEGMIREVLKKWLSGDEMYVPDTKGFMSKSWDAFVPPPGVWREVFRVMKPGATLLCFAGSRTQDLMSISLRLVGFEIKDCLLWLTGQGFPKAIDISKQIDKMAEGEGKRWQGYKTHSLKPAYEPIIMAIKPNEGSYTENALKWAVAGLNINLARIGNEKILAHHAPAGTFAGGEPRKSDTNYYENVGRFPANIILDEEAGRMLDQQSGISKSSGGNIGGSKGRKIYGKYKGESIKGNPGYGDVSGASRFFYCAKASRSERDLGLDGKYNIHCAVKPVRLLEWLCKLTRTPEGGIVLDPFGGSGTTGMACILTGRPFVLIEKEAEYVEIALRRIETIQRGNGNFPNGSLDIVTDKPEPTYTLRLENFSG